MTITDKAHVGRAVEGRLSPARTARIWHLIEAASGTPAIVLRNGSLSYVSRDSVIERDVPVVVPHANRIVLKCEHLMEYSPTGSMYDRLYPWLFLQAEERGRISPESSRVVECSVGNAGAAFAHVAQALGYESRAVILPADIYPARIDQVHRHLNTDVVYSPARVGPYGYIRLLEDMLSEHFLQRHKRREQRLYPISKIRKVPLAPYSMFVRETQQALLRIGLPERIDAFVFGVGAGNTITNVGRCVKAQDSPGRVVVCEHAENPFVALLKQGCQPPLGSPWSEPDYPATTIHGVPLSKLNLDLAVTDDVLLTTRDERDEGWGLANELLGLQAGRPTGMVLCAALKVAEQMEQATILMPIFDSVRKYGLGSWEPASEMGMGLHSPRVRMLVGGCT